jgi:hypothetical protein
VPELVSAPPWLHRRPVTSARGKQPGKTRARAKVMDMILFVRGGTGRDFDDSNSRTRNVTAGSETNKSNRDRTPIICSAED